MALSHVSHVLVRPRIAGLGLVLTANFGIHGEGESHLIRWAAVSPDPWGIPEVRAMLKFRCRNCKQKIGVPEEYAGKRVRCPRCKEATTVPHATEIAPEMPQAVIAAVQPQSIAPSARVEVQPKVDPQPAPHQPVASAPPPP